MADIHLASLPGPARQHHGRGRLRREDEIRGLSGILSGKDVAAVLMVPPVVEFSPKIYVASL
ncbi:hypothetical protein [Bradyrhizobium sp. SEMIA]|uniref:hypothetical protein n=1 Tax=Bradyrhizobium sp. SEMIA TaxID=2597515 RepID=UPI00223F1B4C